MLLKSKKDIKSQLIKELFESGQLHTTIKKMVDRKNLPKQLLFDEEVVSEVFSQLCSINEEKFFSEFVIKVKKNSLLKYAVRIAQNRCFSYKNKDKNGNPMKPSNLVELLNYSSSTDMGNISLNDEKYNYLVDGEYYSTTNATQGINTDNHIQYSIGCTVVDELIIDEENESDLVIFYRAIEHLNEADKEFISNEIAVQNKEKKIARGKRNKTYYDRYNAIVEKIKQIIIDYEY